MTDALGSITKFASQPEKQGIAHRFYLQSLSRELLPTHRIKVCWRHRLPATETIQVVHLPAKRRGHIRGLMKCASVWCCPVCAARITEQRRDELQQAIANHRDQYVPIMVTYTLSHYKSSKLQDTLATLLESYRRLRSGRWWQGFKESNHLAGSVRATEITYTDNGWHPHFHEILFVRNTPEAITDFASYKSLYNGAQLVDPVLDLDFLAMWLEQLLMTRWADVVSQLGGYASLEHGLKVTTQGGDIAAYVAKYGRLPVDPSRWTVAHELTKAIVKRSGAATGLTPYELLEAYGSGVEQAGQLWQEYAAATAGRSQLQWSRGMRELLGLGAEMTDDDAAGKDDREEYRLLDELTPHQWRQIAKRNWQAAVLDAATLDDGARLAEIIGMLEPDPTTVIQLPGSRMD